MSKYRLEIKIIMAALLISVLIIIFEYFKVNNWNTPQIFALSHLTGQKNETSEQETGQLKETDETEQQTSQAPESTAPSVVNQKIVALGDSFTFGFPAGLDYSWTRRLENVLNQPVVNKGKVGQTTQDLLQRFDKEVLSENPGRVIIFVGTGDALRGIGLQQYQDNIQLLVNKARSNNITPVLALPLQFPGVREIINTMREWELSFAQTEKIVILDFASVLYDVDGKFQTGYSGDGKYPSEKGYEVMGDYAAGILK